MNIISCKKHIFILHVIPERIIWGIRGYFRDGERGFRVGGIKGFFRGAAEGFQEEYGE